MFFGISYGEMLVLLGAGAVIFGPKDLPVLARTAGLLTGRAASYLATARNRILGFAEQTEVTQLHQEVQESIQQLRAIRAEIRGGLNVFAPGPYASKLMQRASGLPASTVLQQQSEVTREAVAAPESSSADRQSSEVQVLQSQQELLEAAAMRLQAQQHAQMKVDDQQQQQYVPLPVSAVAAGRARLRSEGVSLGSDIMADALAEAEVARAAQQFIGTTQQQPP